MTSLARKIETFTVVRPWGQFDQFTKNEQTTVKTVFVKKGEAFSLQYHNQRTELWKILSGTPEVTVGQSVVRAKKGDEFEIQPKMNHRVSSIDGDTEFLEISFGEFNEDDIVRIEDKYGRV